MYSIKGNLILGFHGCDESTVDSVVKNGGFLNASQNKYDWLGHGIYFWQDSEERALEYAKELMAHPKRTKGKIEKPAVIGAVISLGYCFDLIDLHYLNTLKWAYDLWQTSGAQLPENEGEDLRLRNLDCGAIEFLHRYHEDVNLPAYDSVRGVFWEGEPLYPNAGFREKNHIQICIRNPNCIKGLFIPRKLDNKFQKV